MFVWFLLKLIRAGLEPQENYKVDFRANREVEAPPETYEII